MLWLNLVFLLIFSFFCVSASSCGSFGTKFITLNDHSFGTLNAELVENCYAIKAPLRLRSQYNYIDRSLRLTEPVIGTIKSMLGKLGFRVERVLGQGNYGRVFSATSALFGGESVAVKVATPQDGLFYDMRAKRECSHVDATQTSCSRPLTQLLPFEVASSLMTMRSRGVVNSRAFGLISSARGQLLFYVIVMRNVKNSSTLLSFVRKCFRRLSRSARLHYMRQVQVKLNEINMALVNQLGIFHNDLKSDNILVRLANESTSCGASGRSGELELYLIDFGNAIMNIEKRDASGSRMLSMDQYRTKPYYVIYKAPELKMGSTSIRLSQMLAWYMGVIAFEMCSNGLDRVNLSPSNEIIYQMPNHNSFDQIIYKSFYGQQQTQLCFESKDLVDYLRRSLTYDPNRRARSSELVRMPFITKSKNRQNQISNKKKLPSSGRMNRKSDRITGSEASMNYSSDSFASNRFDYLFEVKK